MVYAHTAKDNYNLLPFFFDTIMEGGRSRPDIRLTWLKSKNFQKVNNLLVITELIPSALELYREALGQGVKNIAVVMRGREACVNFVQGREISKSLTRIMPDIKFVFWIYNDCTQIDNVRVFQYPLGVCTRKGFSSVIPMHKIKPVAEREYDLNMMMSFNSAKPDRQKLYEFLIKGLCNRALRSHKRCLITRTNLWDDILEFVGVSPDREKAARSYVEALQDSIFTLCPFGKNPETYRIWEAFETGSIPILRTYDPSSMGADSQCDDPFALLIESEAPVVWVAEWHQLEAVLEPYLDDPKKLQDLQSRMLWWWQKFKLRYRHLFYALVDNYFA